MVVRPRHQPDGTDVPESLDALELLPLGSREEVHRAINNNLPEPLWPNPWVAITDGDGWMIEASLQVGDPVLQLMLRITGTGNAMPVIAALCQATGWTAIDVAAWEFIDTDQYE
jgi:hypothetical protein